MSNLERPKNQWAEALWILNDNFMGGVSMVKVLSNYNPFFYKFQSRLNEVIKEHPKLTISKVTLTHKTRTTGKTVHYTHYTPICPKPYLINLYNQINKEGFGGKTNKPQPENKLNNN